jgi:hypothetical protein
MARPVEEEQHKHQSTPSGKYLYKLSVYGRYLLRSLSTVD